MITQHRLLLALLFCTNLLAESVDIASILASSDPTANASTISATSTALPTDSSTTVVNATSTAAVPPGSASTGILGSCLAQLGDNPNASQICGQAYFNSSQAQGQPFDMAGCQANWPGNPVCDLASGGQPQTSSGGGLFDNPMIMMLLMGGLFGNDDPGPQVPAMTASLPPPPPPPQNNNQGSSD
jgi:hypothetical protein